MICIILVAGHGTVLEREIKSDPAYVHLSGIPKALLPGVGGKRILDFWWQAVNMRQLFSEVYLVTNADKYKHFERWATASDFPVEYIINDGTTTNSNRLGAVADFQLVLNTKNIEDDVMVVAGDMLFQDHKFDIAQVINYFHLHGNSDLAIYYEMEPGESVSSRGIVEVCPTTNRILAFHEKPLPDQTTSRLASVVFYCLRKTTHDTVTEYIQQCDSIDPGNFGKYIEWLIHKKLFIIHGMKLPTGFQLIGQVSLADYIKWLEYFSGQKQNEQKCLSFTKRAYARVGLMGNPSDGFHGKTIALSIANFWAEVSITESDKLVLVPHPLNDPTEFGSLGDLHGISRKEGYLGGLRLLQATCKKFYHYCSRKGIALAKRNFTLKYDTNIPRQVGLAGSSAIVTATLKCLLQFFKLSDNDMPKVNQPQFILDVEKQELFIQAGLQDRVIQVYEGLVYMDFSEHLFEQHDHGSYENMSTDELPVFWLAYLSDPSDSGKIHNDVSTRWRNGDTDVVEAMKKFADLTDQARIAIEGQNWTQLADLMNQNFNLRRVIYGDAALGTANLEMVQIARRHHSAVKFPGSGGAVIGLSLDQDNMVAMTSEMQSRGIVVIKVKPHIGGNDHNLPS